MAVARRLRRALKIYFKLLKDVCSDFTDTDSIHVGLLCYQLTHLLLS